MENLLLLLYNIYVKNKIRSEAMQLDLNSILKNTNGFSFSPNHFSNEMSVEIEARHKSLNRVLNKYITEDTLIIETAAGLSPRHLQFKNYNYYELDFNPIIDIKKAIYTAMGYEALNNSLYGLDITNISKLHSVIDKIINLKQYSKTIILSEGLFWYLTKDQIKNITNEFANVFKNMDWIWITSDCPPQDNNEAEYRNIIANSAKVKKGGTFLDYDDFSTFFNGLGLNNTRYKLSDFLEYKDLTSAQLLSFEENKTIKKINTYADIAVLYDLENSLLDWEV